MAQGSPALLALVEQVMPLLLEGPDAALVALREQYASCHISYVEVTPVGFYVGFDVPADTPTCEPPDLAGGDVDIQLAGVEHGAGCLLFVRNGRLSMLEGYTYADLWPEELKVVGLSNPIPVTR